MGVVRVLLSQREWKDLDRELTHKGIGKIHPFRLYFVLIQILHCKMM